MMMTGNCKGFDVDSFMLCCSAYTTSCCNCHC